jgi:2-keto-4-pentenoate hydratase/2-oxohepta-3-ene-1,7-dioic acid hydratase in catechol pathway
VVSRLEEADVRLVTFEGEDGRRAGVLIDGIVVDAREAAAELDAHGWSASVTTIIQQDDATLAALATAAAALRADGRGRGIDELTLAPPVTDPSKVICIGLNYRSHVDEAPYDESAVPILFPKFASSLVGHEADVVIPASSTQMDWECELAVVIGRRASHVALDDALDHVAGYMSFNDVSARDLQLAVPQWTAGKAADTFGPCGPSLVLKDEVPDPQDLRVTTTINGTVMQDSNTALMIFPVARLIEYISSLITLEPGDIIATGTPAGVGFAMKPQVWLNPGDVMEIEVEGLGVLRNRLVTEAAALAARPQLSAQA